MIIAVIIATKGRPDVVSNLLRHLHSQIRRPDRVILSVSTAADAPGAPGPEVVIGPPGLAAQRNRGMTAARGADIVVFYDDDFVPAPGALAGIEALFTARPDLAGATGHVAADGAGAAPIDDDEAAAICRALHITPPPPRERVVIGLYGCNMAIRMTAAEGLLFDERLPLYGWQEDLDFGARLSARGAVVRTSAFAGVHRGVKSARPQETGLGYAQIANPAYLIRQGNIPAGYLLKLMARNVLANHFGGASAKARIDRRRRRAGNWLALWDLARGRLRPERIVEL